MLRASLEDQASAGDRAAAVQCPRLSAHEPSDAADLWFTPRQYVWYSYSGVQYVGVQMAGVCASVLNKVNMFAQWTHQRNSSVWFVFFLLCSCSFTSLFMFLSPALLQSLSSELNQLTGTEIQTVLFTHGRAVQTHVHT